MGRQPTAAAVKTLPAVLGCAALVAAAAGCGTVKTTNTARTGTEQILLTNAWDSALQKVDFRPLTGVPVFLDTSNVTAVDQGWVISSLRQALLSQGVLLRQKAEQAQWVVEARVGAYGTDEHNLLVGISQLTIPQTVVGLPSGTMPEIPFMKKSEQIGVAKLALFAYDRGSGRLVWNSGTMMAVATAKDVHILGLGPIQSGSIRGGADFAGIRLPLPNEDGAGETPVAPGRKPSPFAGAELRHSASFAADADSFAP